ncbi:transcription initiation factor TFIID subunit 4-like [Osmerus eperlanus]|uniref:transcription initiation factor TFIID subunit 4-like n=1 Tax=Osmerus eperlanus TaxID=29151 RepID=UPI002E0D25CE
MDASPVGSDSSTENDQIKTVVVSVNAVPNHAEKVTSSVKTFNGSTIIVSHSSGTTSSLTGMSKICTGSESGSTVVSNELKLSNVTMPPTSNSVIQTCINQQNTVTSSPAAGLGGGLTVTLVKPCMQTAGSYTTLNGDSCTENVKAPKEPLTSAPFRSIQTPLLNSDQSPSSSVPASAESHIAKAEAVQTIIKTEPQTVPAVVTNADNLTPGIIIKNPLLQSTPKTCTPVIAAASPGGIRAIAPQVLAPRLSQTSPNQPNLQNIQLPPGMVLVRSDSGQLMMIHQQILSQMQASRLATPTSTPGHQVQITSVQTPGTSILPRQVTPTIIKQESPALTSAPVTITLQRPHVLQSPIGAALPGTSQMTVSPSTGTTVTLATETMENVKKCKNFLSTLIKLASSGKQSSETVENVKDLVKDLLDGKIEPEDFTSKLYKELSSSPQPYLVPFLKRSLPALRQLTPDSATFIQQSQQPAHTTSTPSPTPMVVLGSPALMPAASASRSHLHPVISKQGHPASLVQQGTIVRPPQVTLATTSAVSLRGQAPSGLMLGQPQVQFKQLQQVPMARPGLRPGFKTISGPASLATAAHKNKLRGAGAGTFREEDDINDVASMAGVNLSEESARILATNSALVGAVTRSCKDEAFLHTSTLQRRILEIGKRCGLVELGPEVVTFLSHATEQRLRNLLERVTEVAQHKNISFKEDSRYEQKSDARAQLKFFEHLDQVEKQRKEEQEREILMKAAKSRARQEDPEQLRLKQKAKEMQQQELAQMRQREANLTALAAIGSRKKRKLGSAASPAGAEGSGFSPSVSGSPGSAASRQFSRQRITRVNLRDLLFCLENERESDRSQLIYKGFLK